MGTKQKAIFLDRDGVINHDPGDYTKNINEFQILPGNLEKMRSWFDSGYLLILITNQGGIAKGLYPKEDVLAIHRYLQGACNLAGFFIHAFYFCPHHQDYSGRCLCRKPGSLLIEKGMHRFNLQPENCVMIGDMDRDVQAATGAGIRGIKIESNSGLASVEI